jgi:hypothetical protein
MRTGELKQTKQEFLPRPSSFLAVLGIKPRVLAMLDSTLPVELLPSCRDLILIAEHFLWSIR